MFGVARIFASFNDTFVHVTDLRFVISILAERKQSKLGHIGGNTENYGNDKIRDNWVNLGGPKLVGNMPEEEDWNGIFG